MIFVWYNLEGKTTSICLLDFSIYTMDIHMENNPLSPNDIHLPYSGLYLDRKKQTAFAIYLILQL